MTKSQAPVLVRFKGIAVALDSPMTLIDFALGGGLGAMAFGLWGRKLFTKWAEESTATSRTKGEGEVIDLLRAELARLSAQNTNLANELNTLQISLQELHAEINSLNRENGSLKIEIANLHREIGRLRVVSDSELSRSQ